MHLTPLAGDTAKISLLALTELCPLPSVLFPLTRFDTGLLDLPWDAGTLVPALGHGDTMIHKHLANPFLPEQVPMGCPSYGSGSQQADEQVLSQTAERGWAQPQQGPAEPLGLNPMGSQHKAQLSLTDARRIFAWMSPGSSSAAQHKLQYQNSSLCWEWRWDGLARQASTNS